MKAVMVRYKVKPERAAENEGYIMRVFEQLERERVAGIHYATFKLDDGVSFVHLASLESADSKNPLLEVPAFKAFLANIRDRCEDVPVTVELHNIGAHGFFGP